MIATETPALVENREIKNYTPLPATKNRLMLYVSTKDSSVLKPTQQVSLDYVETLTPTMEYDINNQTFTILENTSHKERINKAGVTKKDIPEAVQKWAEKNAKVVNKMKGVEAIYSLLSCYPEQVDTQEMVNFYNVYFGGPNNESNIKMFVGDVIKSYYRQEGMDKNKRTLNVNKLRSDLPSIQRLAQAFGDKSGEIITQLIDAEIDLINTPKDELNTKIEKDINTIQADDKRLLEFLIEGQTLDAPKIIPKKITTPPKPTPVAKPAAPTEPFVLHVKKIPSPKSAPSSTKRVTTETTQPELSGRELFDEYSRFIKTMSGSPTISEINRYDVVRELANQFEDNNLPNIIGVSLKDLGEDIHIVSAYSGLRREIIQYELTKKSSREEVAKQLTNVKEVLDDFNQQAGRIIENFQQITIEYLIREHDKLLGVEETPKPAPSFKEDFETIFNASAPPPSVSPPSRRSTLHNLGQSFKKAGEDLVESMSRPENILEVVSHIAENAAHHVGSLDGIIRKVSESHGGVVELSMDGRGLTKMMPQLVVDSINVAIHENVSKLLSVKLADEKIKDITISNGQAEMELNIAMGPITRTLKVEIKNNPENTSFDQPIITINPPTIKNPIPLQKIKEYNLQQIVDDLVAKNTIDTLLKENLGKHKDIQGKIVVENVSVYFDKDDQMRLVFITKAP